MPSPRSCAPPALCGLLAVVLLALLKIAPAQAKEAPSKTSAAEALVAKADQISKEVAKLRGLKLKQPIRRGVMSKAQIKKRILKLLAKEYSPAELDAESLALKRFGLIPADSDYVKMMVKLLEDQIAGFYDQHEKKLYIAGWAPMGGEMLMAHEIDHALQDQHFDLKAFMAPNKENGDSMAARQALVEGDGMALMLEFQMASMKQAPPWGNPMILAMLTKSMGEGMAAMSHVPLAMREALVFPYVGGLEFLAHFRKHHTWSRIDKIYKKPPLSTEHILHPEKYEAYEKPQVVTARLPSSLKGYSQRVSNVQGEKGLQLFLRSHGVKETRASKASAGWGGDRMAVYAPAGHTGTSLAGTVGVSLTAWDEEADAEEFVEALEHALPSLAGKGSLKSGSDAIVRMPMPGGGLSLVERKGDKVLLIIDAPAKTAAALRKELWTRWSVATK